MSKTTHTNPIFRTINYCIKSSISAILIFGKQILDIILNIRLMHSSHKAVRMMLFFLFLIVSINIYSQCSPNYYDTGGAGGDYSNNEDISTTHTVPAGFLAKMNFASFDTEAGYDFLKVYDGPNTSSPLLANLDGNALPSDILGTSNQLTIRFTSDGSTEGSGYEYTLTKVKTYTIATGSDDAEEDTSNTVETGSTDLELVQEGTLQIVGLRFTNIDLAPNDQIKNAYITFEADESDSGITNLTFNGELALDPITYSNTNKISTRTPTLESQSWNSIPAWTNGEYHSTPDLSLIIQEIIGQSGWSTGNALAMIITGSGKRVAESYDGNGDPAVLFIESCIQNNCGAVGEWKFEDDVTDSSPSGNNGTVVGSPSYSSGKVNQAIQLSGSGQYVNLGNPPELQITDNMTLAMWLNPADFNSRRNPWAKAYGGEGTITQEINGHLNFYWGSAGANASPYATIGTNTPISLNTWTHVALVKSYTDGTIKWYINGVEDNSLPLTMATTASSLNAYIGNGYTSNYSGLMDEVKIYNCSLSGQDILDLYNLEEGLCDLVIRAKGACGGEQIDLMIDGSVASTFTLTNSYADYYYSNFESGKAIGIYFADGSSGGCNYDVAIDYVEVDNVIYQSEISGTHSNSACNNGELLYCQGTLDFGARVCNGVPDEICDNNIDDDGDGDIDCADSDCALAADAGIDQTQCYNALFNISANSPPNGITGTWSVVSGNAYTLQSLNSPNINFTVPNGTATLRWTVTGCSSSAQDDVVLTNTTSCSTACINPLNINGDLETEGTATNFNLTFESTPALLIDDQINPEGWSERYGGNTPNTSIFNGAYYINKTGSQGDPHSGTHMVYLKGTDYCFSPFRTITNVSCGKTYRFSMYAAAYSYNTGQANSEFKIEFGAGNESGTPSNYAPNVNVTLPASNSWNDLNWNRYQFDITIPADGFEYGDFYFTSSDNFHGVVLDDICITEIYSGSDANAGEDQHICANQFQLNANTLPDGYSGTWSVNSGNVSFNSLVSPIAIATLSSGSTASIRWTVNNGYCSSFDDVTLAYTSQPDITVNNPTICPEVNTLLTVQNCTGDILWSTGETTESIIVAPAVSTVYTVSCTESKSSNQLLNPAFESATNFEDWENWAGSGVTTNSAHIHSGSKAAFIDASSAWGGMGQYININEGEYYNLSFWAKASNINIIPKVGYLFFDINGAEVGRIQYTWIDSTDYKKYATSFIVPANAVALEISARSDTPNSVYLDDFELVEGAGCIKTATSTVTTQSCEFDPDVCYLIADGATDGSDIDSLYTFNHLTGAVTFIGSLGVTGVEAMAMDVERGVIYAENHDSFGTINQSTGLYTAISNDMGQANGVNGLIDVGNFDGMTFDSVENVVWATIREADADGLPDDIMVKVNPTTGMPFLNAFGTNVGYVIVPTNEHDIDDIAIDPNGILYAISNFGDSGNQRLGTINKTTGAFTEIGDYGIEDVEGLMYTGAGQLLATTGKDGDHKNSLYSIDAGTGIASFIGSILPAQDVEACACNNSGFIDLQIGDFVWADIDEDGIQDPIEPGVSGVVVNLLHSNNSPVLNGSNIPRTTITDGNGYYLFDRLPGGDYKVEFILPSGASFSIKNSGVDSALDSDANLNGKTDVISIAPSVNNMSYDAGLLGTNPVIRDCDNDGELFVTIDTSYLVRFDKSGNLIDTFITFDGEAMRDMEIGPDNNLYVASKAKGYIRKYSLITGALLETYGGPRKLRYASGLEFMPSGDLLITNSNEDFVAKLNLTTGVIDTFIAPNSGGLDSPRNGIEFGPDGHLYVASKNTNEILKFNGTTGAFITVFSNDIILDQPWDLTFGPDGYMWVANYGGDNVMRFNATTGVLYDNIIPYQTGGLNGAIDIQFGDDGYVYVGGKSGTDNIYRYNATTGAFIDKFVSTINNPNAILFAKDEGCACLYDDPGIISGFETICGDYDPALITSQVSPTIYGAFTYTWEQRSKVCGSTYGSWSTIAGANSSTYNPNTISNTTQFKRLIIRDNLCSPDTLESNPITKFVEVNYTDGGAIDGDESACYGYDPALITSISLPTGGCSNQLITNPNPGFPIDFLNNNCSWIEYTMDNNLTMYDNGDGTLIISGNIKDGVDASFDGGGCISTPCGTNDAWYLELILTDKQNWTTFSGNGGQANLNGSCSASNTTLDYWNVSGVLTGIGCNYGRELIISGPKSPYRLQIGSGGNEMDNTCAYGLSTWFDISNGASALNADIYGFTIPLTEDYIWQQRSIPCGGSYTSWSTISGAVGLSYDPTSITQTTDYRRGVRKSNCSASYTFSNIITKTVLCDDGVAVINESPTICSGLTTTLTSTVTGGSGSPTYQWQISSSDSIFTYISGATSASYTTDALVATTYYSVVVSWAGGCPDVTSASSKVTVEIASNLLEVTANENNICPGSTVVLTANGDLGTGGLIDYTQWTLGTGSIGDFNRNGEITENHRINGLDPWGNSTIVWEARPQALSGADGGWNSDRFNVDNTKLYRYSVWVNRNEIGANGRFYLGSNGYGSTNGLIDITTNASTSNAYFYISTNPPNFEEDEWVLVVGHIYPHTHSGNTIHPDAGVYTINEGSVGSVSKEFKWLPQSIESVHRSYLFYSDDISVRQRFVFPRVDVIDGNEPSVDDLLAGFDSNSGLGDGANWEWFTGSCGGTSVGSGRELTVNPIVTTKYYVRSESPCGNTNCDSIIIVVDNTAVIASASNDGPVTCSNPNVTLTALPAGLSYEWSGGGTGQTKTVTADGVYTVTVTDADGCYDSAQTTVTKNISTPTADAGLDTTICRGTAVTLTASGGGNYAWSTGGTSQSIVVAPDTTTTYAVQVSYANGCNDLDQVTIIVNDPINTVIDFNGSLCLDVDSKLSAESTGGSGNYIYSWTGPNSFTSNLDTISIVDDGNYYVTVSDEYGCIDNTSGFVYEAYEPFVFTLNTTICEGEDIDLSINSGTAVGYQWGPNADNDTTSSVNVIPLPPSTTYNVTITSDIGCTSEASATINVTSLTPTNISGPDSLCIGENSQLAPNTGGTWISTNSGVAIVDDSGFITAIGSGTVNFIFSDTITTCDSDPTDTLFVNEIPLVSVIGPSALCEGSTTTLSPSTGGTWTSSNTGVATVDNNGLVTAVGPGNAIFVYTNAITHCSSNATTAITVFAKPTINLTGEDTICVNETTQLNPNNGGTWESSNTLIATIASNGIVTGVSGGTATFTYTQTSTGCESDSSIPITILPLPIVGISGNTTVCIGSTTTLTPTSGGTWTSSNDNIATVNNSGIVTGVGEGTVNFIFTANNGCNSLATGDIQVDDNGNITLSGDPILCLGETMQMSSSNGGGNWISSNSSIATVNSSGLVTSIDTGSVTIIYDHNSSACFTEPSFGIVIYKVPVVGITGSDTICSGFNTTLSPTTGGTWTSSDNNIATITDQGVVTGVSGGSVVFNFTSSESLCPSLDTDTIRVVPDLSIVLDYNGSICLTDDSDLAPIITGGTSGFSYNWVGPNSFTSTDSLIAIVDDGNYALTVTDVFGCSDNTNGFIYERYEPFVFTLNSTICEGENVDLSVNSSTSVAYQWGANANNATTKLVTVTPAPPSTTYQVTITNDIGCQTTANATLNVIPKPTISITGPTTICEGDQTNLSPTSGGFWVSSDNNIAIVDDTGLVTGLNPGSITFSFKDTSTGCWSDPSTSVTISSNTIVNITGDNTLCMGDSAITSISLTGGTWTTSAPSVATIDNSGEVQSVSTGSTNINYIPTGTACYIISDFEIVVSDIPMVTITGPSTICEGDNSSLSPSSGGIWSSSDMTIATVTNGGIVTGVDGGNVFLSWENSSTGCSNTTNSPIAVVDKAAVNLTGPGDICVGDFTTLSPTSGGIWISSDNAIASVSSNGFVLGKSSGVAVFSFYESSNGCLSDETISVNVNGKPSVVFNGPSNICIGDTTYITPAANGTWNSDNSTVATITNQGMIIGLTSGNAIFTYTDTITGCISDNSLPLSVNAKPATDLFGQTNLCIGESITISPTTGGTWSSLNTDIATITNGGVVTGVAIGATGFVFILNSTGCSSDTTSDITVHEKPIVDYSGPNSVCEGSTSSMTPSTGGSWSSSNTNVAIITASGAINAISPGTAKFTYTSSSTGCVNSPIQDFTVVGKPNIAITGPHSICIGGITSLSPTNGGIWLSNDTTIAIIENDGTITGVGGGNTTFIFTNSTTGCSSTNSTPITVYTKPAVQITGQDEICIGSTTTLSPNSGGLWTSSNDAIATITSSGLVTGASLGTATFIFVENITGCTSDASLPVSIIEKPTVAITGSTNICEGITTTLSPSIGGNWTSNNPAFATVNTMGIVTGVSQGVAKFTFVSDEGCISDETAPITIHGSPTIFNPGDDELCVGSSISIFPANGGTWESTDTLIATITNSGVINGIAAGNVNFVYTDISTGCTSDTSNVIIVHGLSNIILLGEDSICIGNNTQFSPTTGGLWYSNDGSIAAINNTGLVTGIAVGDATFYFVNSSNDCQSENSLPINIKAKPNPQFLEGSQLCIGDTTYVANLGSGSWESNNITIASISNTGMIIGKSQGNVKFRFNSSNSCSSNWSANMTINASPNVGLSGPGKLCINGQTNVFPSNGGSWSSSNTSIASILNSGLVTGHTEGTVNLVYQDSINGCISTDILNIEVNNPPTVNYDGDSIICIGFTTNLVSNKIGIWKSSDTRIATVSNGGVVTSHAPGKVTISIIDSETGCSSGANSKVIAVEKCLNHDFNVTIKNLEISGDLSTNDNAILTTYNSNPTLKFKPAGSIVNLAIENDGTYTFSGNTPGKYIYEIEVCIAPSTFGCPSTILEITVSDNIYGFNNPINNLEFTTTFAHVNINTDGQQVVSNLAANDKCLNSLGCSIDESKSTITNNSSKGIENLNATGILTYTPIAGNIGEDTIIYSICNSDVVDRCDDSYLFVTINADNASNSIVAPDDFVFTIGSIPISDNVILNDSDPENDNIAVVPIGTVGAPVSVIGGSYFIEADGDFTFTPSIGFSGPTEIVYTLCDDNVDQACMNATIHILVFGDMAITTRVFLEGALIFNNNEKTTSGRPLMRDNLRKHPFDGLNYIPMSDPYSSQISGLDLTTLFFHEGPGVITENKNIVSPSVLDITGENAIVDWVFMELRHKNDSTQVIGTRSALLQRDGDIVDMDGVSPVAFNGIATDSIYLVVRHRSHLGVMSMLVANDDFVDFTNPATPVFAFTDKYGIDFTGYSQKSTVKSGYMALWSGDFNASGKIKFTNPGDDQNVILYDVLFYPSNNTFNSNYDFSYGYNQGDFDLNGKAKFANPDDDQNMLFSQIVLFPLNMNFLDNFDFFIEQIPK